MVNLPPLPPSPSLVLSVHSLAAARDLLDPADFRHRLRRTLLADPSLTLRQVARSLGVTQQRVALMVGRLDRPIRMAPKKEVARGYLAELKKKVAAGESAEQAAKELGISLAQVYKLGFRAKDVRPVHGTQERLSAGCNCWRCRRAAGIAAQRGPKMSEMKKAAIEDLLAWRDPDNEIPLTQAAIGQLVGVGQAAVSRVARSAQ